jgi:hypothetical protein
MYGVNGGNAGAISCLLCSDQVGLRQPQFDPSNTAQTSRGKTRNCRCKYAEFIKHIPQSQMENFVVTCRLVPDVSHLVSGSCSSPRNFALDFLQTPPRDEALALSLTFGSAPTW